MSDELVYIKGNAYLPVAQRVMRFRNDFPIGSETPGRIVSYRTDDAQSDTAVGFRAEIYVGEALIATGHAELPKGEKGYNFGQRFVEKVETSAIGRALGYAGYGTLAAFEDDEKDEDGNDFIADAPQPKRASYPTSGSGRRIGAPKNQNSPQGERPPAEFYDGQVWTIGSLTVAKTKKGKPYIQVFNHDGAMAAAFTRELFEKEGYDVDPWADVGEYKVSPPAKVRVTENNGYLNVDSVEQMTRDEMADADEIPFE